MALVTRTIAGTLKDANGTALVGVNINFTPSSLFGSGGVLIIPTTEQIVTNGSGAYTITVFVDDVTGTQYKIEIGPATFNTLIPAGATTTLDELL
jgi:hypothetical protein